VTGRHAVILAAGAARRFGGGKLIAPWRGRPLIAWSVEAALASGVGSVTVVLGADAELVDAVLDPAVRTVICDDWREGMAASLRTGLGSLPVDATSVLIFLGDMPAVSPALGRALLDAVEAGAPAALPYFGEVPAHPVAVGRLAWPLLTALEGDRGGRDVLAALPGARIVATDDAGSIVDIDRPADLSEKGLRSG